MPFLPFYDPLAQRLSSLGRPRGALSALGLCVLSCGWLSACGAVGTGTDEETEDPDVPVTDESIRFDPSGTLMLAPAQSAVLQIRAEPPNKQMIVFELLTESDAFDGFLLASSARADDSGVARVELTAPTQPSIFMARASLGELQVTRAISVSDQGYGSLVVLPQYAGEREITQWTASARAGVTCEDIESTWIDGPLVATGSSQATIVSVPSGPTIALSLRGGQLVSGCVAVTGLADGEMRTVEVVTVDRPIDVSMGELEITLGVDSMTTEFASHLEQAVVAGTQAFAPEGTSDASALLARMESELDETDGAAFAGARDSLGLVAAVDTTWNYTTPLSTALTTLLMDATAALIGDEVFRGRMELDGTNSAFALEEAAGVPAAVSGFLQGATWTAMGEAGDTLVMGGTLTYEPVRWLSAIAETQAETSPEDALVEAAQCQAVALALVEAADGPTHATCEEECLIDLCEQAVVSIWPDVSESGTDLSSLQLGISGEAILTGAAQVAEMEGTWVGRRGEEESSLKGPARAAMIVR